MPPPTLPYRAAALTARVLLPVVALARPRLRLMREERAAFRRLLDSTPTQPFTVLFHAASAGELRQLEPVIRRFRDRRPDTRTVVTWFSTSGAAVGRTLEADLAGALPWDSPWETGAFLDQLKPTLIVVGKLDLWPEFAWQAERRGIPITLVAGTVRWNSSRLRWPTRRMLEPTYAVLTGAGAISELDATRLIQLGVPSDRITVTGDPRSDSVLERLSAAAPVTRDPRLLVAGSTWEIDEVLLLRSFAEVRRRHPDARLLIVPHQPSTAVFARITRLAREQSLPDPVTRRAAAETDPLVVDMEVGGLALSYRLGAMAYVGGGFNLSGPHSVLEPAATGVPTAIGSMSSSHEALALEAAGGLTRLDNDAALMEMPDWWSRMLENDSARASSGEAARACVEAGRGAAERTLQLLERYLPEPTSGPRPLPPSPPAARPNRG